MLNYSISQGFPQFWLQSQPQKNILPVRFFTAAHSWSARCCRSVRRRVSASSWWLWTSPAGYITLWWTYKKLWKMAIEIVDFPMKNGGFPWQNGTVHQRVPQNCGYIMGVRKIMDYPKITPYVTWWIYYDGCVWKWRVPQFLMLPNFQRSPYLDYSNPKTGRKW